MSTGLLRASAWRVDWRRLARRIMLLLPPVFAVVAIYLGARAHNYGFDFQGGMWKAGKAVLAGSSPYPSPHVQVLLRHMNAFIPPPVFGVLATPFAVLPWTSAIVLWSLVCVGAFAAALYIAGVRDWRVYVLASCSFPFISSLGFGQTEGLLALGVASAWRWRDSPGGPAAVGAIVAAKLLVWPLIVWLLITRGIRAAAIAVASATALLVGSWACVGFKGLLAYPRLLAADARAFEGRTHSIVSLLMRLGASIPAAQIVAILVAGAVAIAIASRSKPSDWSVFLAAIAFSLLASPLLEMHYLTLVLVALAIARPRLDGLWIFAIDVFWISPLEPPRAVWQIAVVLMSVIVILMRARSRQLRASKCSPTNGITASPNAAMVAS